MEDGIVLVLSPTVKESITVELEDFLRDDMDIRLPLKVSVVLFRERVTGLEFKCSIFVRCGSYDESEEWPKMSDLNYRRSMSRESRVKDSTLKERFLHGVNAKNCLQAIPSEHSSTGISCTQKGREVRRRNMDTLEAVILIECKYNYGAIMHERNLSLLMTLKREMEMQRQEEKVNMREAVVAGLVVQKAVGQSQTARIQVAVREIHNTSCGCRYRDQSNRRCEHLLRTQIDALHNILVMNNRILSNSVTNYDTYCWNTNIDSNTTPTSTNYVSLGEGEIDQVALCLHA
ncbi:hypothetical protein Tco_0971590 [Tanacetum coccineum]